MTPATLRNYTAKDLAKMAKEQGVSGWHSMRKEQLIRALTQRPSSKRGGGKRTVKTATNGRAATNGRSKTNGRATAETRSHTI